MALNTRTKSVKNLDTALEILKDDGLVFSKNMTPDELNKEVKYALEKRGIKYLPTGLSRVVDRYMPEPSFKMASRLAAAGSGLEGASRLAQTIAEGEGYPAGAEGTATAAADTSDVLGAAAVPLSIPVGGTLGGFMGLTGLYKPLSAGIADLEGGAQWIADRAISAVKKQATNSRKLLDLSMISGDKDEIRKYAKAYESAQKKLGNMEESMGVFTNAYNTLLEAGPSVAGIGAAKEIPRGVKPTAAEIDASFKQSNVLRNFKTGSEKRAMKDFEKDVIIRDERFEKGDYPDYSVLSPAEQRYRYEHGMELPPPRSAMKERDVEITDALDDLKNKGITKDTISAAKSIVSRELKDMVEESLPHATGQRKLAIEKEIDYLQTLQSNLDNLNTIYKNAPKEKQRVFGIPGSATAVAYGDFLLDIARKGIGYSLPDAAAVAGSKISTTIPSEQEVNKIREEIARKLKAARE